MLFRETSPLSRLSSKSAPRILEALVTTDSGARNVIRTERDEPEGRIEVTGSAWRAAAGLTIATLALYSTTAAPDLTLVDSAELALACFTGGVAHPPGVPLYLLLGGAFSHLPLGSPARALNLMSALWAALAVGAVFLGTERLLATLEKERRRRFPAAVIAAAAFATAYNPWTWSAVTEVYSLNVFLAAGALACGWAVVAGAKGGRPASWRPVTGACVLAALGLANHHATASLLFPVLLGVAWLGAPSLLKSRRFWTTSILAVAGSLSLYLYLFVAAARDPAMNWGGIESWSLLVRHVTGAQYSLQVGTPAEESWRVAGEYVRTLIEGVGWPALLVILAGGALVWGRARDGRRRGLVLGVPVGLVALNLLLSINYVAGPEDRMAYDLPATVAWCTLAGVGAWALLARIRGRNGLLAAALLFVVVAGWNVRRNLPLCDLSDERTARILVEEMVEDVPEGSVVMTAEWNFYAPFVYLQHVEGFRPDLRVIDVLILRRFWYLDYLERHLPELVERSRPEFDALCEQIDRFDLGLPYDQLRIQDIYDAAMRRWIEVGMEDGGAFVDWASVTRPQEISWIRTMPTVPSGLLLKFGRLDGSLVPDPISPKDAANLRYVRGKLPADAPNDPARVIPRHDPYRKVWSVYSQSAEASLSMLAQSGDPSFPERRAEYAEWFPGL